MCMTEIEDCSHYHVHRSSTMSLISIVCSDTWQSLRRKRWDPSIAQPLAWKSREANATYNMFGMYGVKRHFQFAHGPPTLLWAKRALKRRDDFMRASIRANLAPNVKFSSIPCTFGLGSSSTSVVAFVSAVWEGSGHRTVRQSRCITTAAEPLRTWRGK